MRDDYHQYDPEKYLGFLDECLDRFRRAQELASNASLDTAGPPGSG